MVVSTALYNHPSPSGVILTCSVHPSTTPTVCALGKVKRMVDPMPAWDSTQIRPPCRSTTYKGLRAPNHTLALERRKSGYSRTRALRRAMLYCKASRRSRRPRLRRSGVQPRFHVLPRLRSAAGLRRGCPLVPKSRRTGLRNRSVLSWLQVLQTDRECRGTMCRPTCG